MNLDTIVVNDVTVGQLLTQAVSQIGENIQVRRFVRYLLGEADD